MRNKNFLAAVFVVIAAAGLVISSSCGKSGSPISPTPQGSSVVHLSASPPSGSTVEYGRSVYATARYTIAEGDSASWLVTCLSTDGLEIIPNSCTGVQLRHPSGVIENSAYLPDKSISRTDYIIHQLTGWFGPGMTPVASAAARHTFYFQ